MEEQVKRGVKEKRGKGGGERRRKVEGGGRRRGRKVGGDWWNNNGASGKHYSQFVAMVTLLSETQEVSQS